MQQKINPFAGRLSVSLAEAAYAVFGWTPSTTRTKFCKKDFPLPYIKIGGRKLCRVSDLIALLDSQPVINCSDKRRPGRPTKRVQFASTMAEGGEQ